MRNDDLRREPSSTPSPLAGIVAPILVVALLAGMVAEKATYRRPDADADAYHETARRAAARIPFTVGEWLGTDVEVPTGAVQLLRPNVLINRRFESLETGETVSLLFVHCRDARDLLGHYPPFCYPAHGFTLRSVEERDWDVGGVKVEGKRYRFTKEELAHTSELVIDNFMMLPQGVLVRDMDQVSRTAQDMRLRFFGAGQIQILTDAAISDERRDEVFGTIVASCLPVIREIGSGVAE